MRSLCESLGNPDPVASALAAEDAQRAAEAPATSSTSRSPVAAKAFCEAIVSSPEFRTYIAQGIVMGDLAPVFVFKVMDHVWGKPVERVEVRTRPRASKTCRWAISKSARCSSRTWRVAFG